MIENWQIAVTVTACLAGLALAARFPMRASQEAWVDAWHYAPSRRPIAFSRWRRWRATFWFLVCSTALAGVIASTLYLRASPG